MSFRDFLNVCQQSRLRRNFGWRWPGVALLVVAAVILLRSGQQRVQATPEPAEALPSVAVARIARENLFIEKRISGEFRPYEEVELHAKVSGFLQHIDVDFGDEVKAGQALATLEVPELQDELNNAIAVEQRTEADYKNAHLAYTRLLAVNATHTNLVAQQDLDAAEAKDSTTTAAIAAAKADVKKFETLVAYTKITAPFDGVITRRYADPGALIQAGTASETQSLPLVRISNNYRLRGDIPVPVDDVKDIRLNDPVEVRVDSLNGKSFTGKIARFTREVDDRTRTMKTELEVDNRNLELVPGMWMTAVLKLQRRPDSLAVPVEAVSGGDKPTVYVVNANHEVEQRSITIGLETPTKWEVISGLREGDLVIISNPGQIQAGQKVEPKVENLMAVQ